MQWRDGENACGRHLACLFSLRKCISTRDLNLRAFHHKMSPFRSNNNFALLFTPLTWHLVFWWIHFAFYSFCLSLKKKKKKHTAAVGLCFLLLSEIPPSSKSNLMTFCSLTATRGNHKLHFVKKGSLHLHGERLSITKLQLPPNQLWWNHCVMHTVTIPRQTGTVRRQKIQLFV